MEKMILDLEKYREAARKTVAEGQVLLRNENNVLPLSKGEKIAVFGRIQLNYYKSGTGSGGLVNAEKVTGILDALLENEEVIIDKELLEMYKAWEKEHPFDEGQGWGKEPWSQEEMPLSTEIVEKTAAKNTCALVIIGRTAGEDQDNFNHPGSYLLTTSEEDMLDKVRKGFSKMVVILNVGNIIDMGFVDKYQPDAVLYAWQGGETGGLGTADILTGTVNPSGKLADTIAYRIEDYPSNNNFGNLEQNIYEEDIYVGYRYFETGAPDAVRYPFGFGLSYTSFEIRPETFATGNECINVSVNVKNTGTVSGKEVVQIYVKAPQGQLGKPVIVLAAFGKTKELAAGEEETIFFEIPFKVFASYDETGKTGFRSAYVLEAGDYCVYTGNSSRNLNEAGRFLLDETRLICQCSNAMAPKETFQRLRPQTDLNGNLSFTRENVPIRQVNPAEKRLQNLPTEIPITGDRGYKLSDVKHGVISMETFIAQLSVEDLACIIRGEGMGSPKVTPGTAAAFGGVSETLKKFGIPCGCCADGPSGMRLDSGMKAFSLPNGTLIACTFNTKLVEELYTFTGIEMVKNKVDTLLGPGMNIHRHPLNGRNFEYFSEDPLLTGKMAAAQIRAMHKAGVTGTLKHFCANNQETQRNSLNSIVSERALREIYLKGFEIAILEADADSIMTTYGAVNGLWTAGSYDLNTVILRDEWGFQGIVMTDWWAKINNEGEEAVRTNYAGMARAQNDIYMVCSEADKNTVGDNTLSSIEDGTLALGELQRNAMNICSFLMHTNAFDRINGNSVSVKVIGTGKAIEEPEPEVVYHKIKDGKVVIRLENIEAKKGSAYVFALDIEKMGGYRIQMKASSMLGELAQLPVTLLNNGSPQAVFTFNGTEGNVVQLEKKLVFFSKYAVIQLYFAQNGLDIKEISFTLDKPIYEIPDLNAYVQS
ncbi:MAG: glycoside hydrolase family 3 C-terminal domain-containing protein [Blautia sp.]|nr:glycoside hydrolase family 3 C-terminal domain-containing protein [Lachnoclostridium sp.]MCM1211486.1 glycoside hydrolase family 3 C-terminal domain-containing protein [Blautia sp.]